MREDSERDQTGYQMGDTGTPSRKFLTRKEAAEYITATYFKVTAGTLATWATYEEGPAYRVIGGHAHYSKKDIDDWVDQPRHNGKVAPKRIMPTGGALGVLDRK